METVVHKEERPLKELFSDLMQEISRMLRDEVALAKAELSKKISAELKDMAMLAVGGVIMYAGVFFLLGAAVAALWTVLPLWASSLLIGIAVSVAGYLMIQKGKKDLKQRKLKPEQTIETIKETREWIQKKT